MLKPMESCWLVNTTESANQLFERLHAKMDRNDNLIVIKVCRSYEGWFSKEVHDWIKEHVPYC